MKKCIYLAAALAAASGACTLDETAAPPPTGDDVQLLEGFTAPNGEEVSFLVADDGDAVDVIVRTRHSADVTSTVAALAEEASPLELWLSLERTDAPEVLWRHHDQLAAAGLVATEPALLDKATVAAFTSESVEGGQGNCSDFAAEYTWGNKYVSPTVSGSRTASLGAMERFRTGACNRSDNAATETLTVHLDRWISQISGWDTSYFSETIARGEAVTYTRTLWVCSYYQHRLRVTPSTSHTYYRYAGQWADVTCGGVGTTIGTLQP